MTRIILVVIFFIVSYNLNSQHKIKIQFDEYPSDTLVIGYYLGEKTLVHDTLSDVAQNTFEIWGVDTLAHGVYMMLSQPTNQFFQFLVTDDQDFDISVSDQSYSQVKFSGSTENELFADYLQFINQQREEAQPIRDYIIHADSMGLDASIQKSQLEDIDAVVSARQEEILNAHPDALISQLIRASIEIVIPEFEGEEAEVNNKRYRYYKEHYFDNVDLANPMTLRTPFLHNKINTYVNQLTPLNPDSIMLSIDSVLSWVKPAPDTYRYYLSYFVNDAANSRTIGMDAVFVHLADNYYLKGLADWADEDIINKIRENTNKIRPTLIGNTAPNLTLYKQDGTPIAIDDIDYKYLVLLFWAPDCGHCKKSMPDAVKFEKDYRDKGVKVLAICTKHKEKTETCWEILDEKDMSGFINVADELHRSRFKVKFNISRTPKIYILNKEREILIKDLGAEHLAEVMNQIIDMEGEEGN